MFNSTHAKVQHHLVRWHNNTKKPEKNSGFPQYGIESGHNFQSTTGNYTTQYDGLCKQKQGQLQLWKKMIDLGTIEETTSTFCLQKGMELTHVMKYISNTTKNMQDIFRMAYKMENECVQIV